MATAIDLSRYALGQNPRRGLTRMIDPGGYSMIPEVTVLEDGDDELEITKHPVEQGASISDHAYKQPAEVHVQVGWSDAYVGSDASLIYEQILYLQAERRPFIVYTGKRSYQNMLVASIRQHTDEKMEFGFLADIVFREILLVNTQTALGSGLVGSTTSDLADPASNTATTTQGTLQNQPATLDSNQISNGGGAVEDDALMPAIVIIPLTPTPQIWTSVLEGVTYVMRLQWNVPADVWVLDINDVSGAPLITGIPLITGTDLLRQYSRYLGPPGQMLVISTQGPPDHVPDRATLGVTGFLYYLASK